MGDDDRGKSWFVRWQPPQSQPHLTTFSTDQTGPNLRTPPLQGRLHHSTPEDESTRLVSTDTSTVTGHTRSELGKLWCTFWPSRLGKIVSVYMYRTSVSELYALHVRYATQYLAIMLRVKKHLSVKLVNVPS